MLLPSMFRHRRVNRRGVSSPGSRRSRTGLYSTSLQMSDCTIRGNEALGGAGGAGTKAGAGGPGGLAYSGGFHVTEGSIAIIRNTTFIRNLSQGGAGGAGNTGRAGGAGATGQGGGLANVLSRTTVSNSRFVENVAQGGAGGTGGANASGGAGADGQGGAVWNVLALDTPAATSLTISNSRITRNQAVGGAGGAAGTGGKGAMEARPTGAAFTALGSASRGKSR